MKKQNWNSAYWCLFIHLNSLNRSLLGMFWLSNTQKSLSMLYFLTVDVSTTWQAEHLKWCKGLTKVETLYAQSKKLSQNCQGIRHFFKWSIGLIIMSVDSLVMRHFHLASCTRSSSALANSKSLISCVGAPLRDFLACCTSIGWLKRKKWSPPRITGSPWS